MRMEGWLADRLPHPVQHLEHGEGHLSLALGGINELLELLQIVS